MTSYEVKDGDKEYEIANKFNVSVGNLRTANKYLPQPYLVVGRTINVPTENETEEQPQAPSFSSATTAPFSGTNVATSTEDAE